MWLMLADLIESVWLRWIHIIIWMSVIPIKSDSAGLFQHALTGSSGPLPSEWQRGNEEPVVTILRLRIRYTQAHTPPGLVGFKWGHNGAVIPDRGDGNPGSSSYSLHGQRGRNVGFLEKIKTMIKLKMLVSEVEKHNHKQRLPFICIYFNVPTAANFQPQILLTLISAKVWNMETPIIMVRQIHTYIHLY